MTDSQAHEGTSFLVPRAALEGGPSWRDRFARCNLAACWELGFLRPFSGRSLFPSGRFGDLVLVIGRGRPPVREARRGDQSLPPGPEITGSAASRSWSCSKTAPLLGSGPRNSYSCRAPWRSRVLSTDPADVSPCRSRGGSAWRAGRRRTNQAYLVIGSGLISKCVDQ